MSRKIESKASVTITEEEKQLRQTENGKLLFTSYQGQTCALLIQNDRLVEASFFPKEPSRIGAIYIGRVKSMVQNIDACFVEIANGEVCFLPLKDTANACLLNRSFDGRILEGDELLVQVIRDAHKTKRASVTTQISLSNDYFAISIGSEKVGYSLKLSQKTKDSVKRLFTEMVLLNPQKSGCLVQDCRALLSIEMFQKMEEEGFKPDTLKLPPTGLIVRTKAEGLESAEELLGHFYALSTQYIRLLHIARHRSCFSCLKEADIGYGPIVQEFARLAQKQKQNADSTGECTGGDSDNDGKKDIKEDAKSNLKKESKNNHLKNDTDNDGKNVAGSAWEVVTDQELMYEQLKSHCEKHDYKIKVRLYKDSMLTLSALYAVNSKLETALESRVWLKSGGYLVIEPTEALTVIDVNSGKYEAGMDARDTYRKINFEAAEEVAFQLRLRNLSGIIIVDFINMRSPSDNAELLIYLKSLVKEDKVKTMVVDMTPLGLVEITRKKISKPLREQLESFSGGR